jgi:hypothetical protein
MLVTLHISLSLHYYILVFYTSLHSCQGVQKCFEALGWMHIKVDQKWQMKKSIVFLGFLIWMFSVLAM